MPFLATNPNNCDDDDDCKIYRDFAHGSSLESINNIVANGINIDISRKNKGGGLVNIPGFFTIELTRQDGSTVGEKLSQAYRFGQLRGSPVAVLIMQLCDDIYRELEASNKILLRQITGVEEFTETIFKPESFDTLNQQAKLIDVLIP
jgi:hypothetical protein